MLKPVLSLAALALASYAPPMSVRTVSITAHNYSFEAPDTVLAGQTLVKLTNAGTEIHHAYFIRLDAGKTMGDFFAAMKAGGPPPAWSHDAGGPNAPAPGSSTEAVVNFTPGNYILICVIPSPDGTPHVMKGMSHAFTVVPSTGVVQQSSEGTSEVAAPDAHIALKDYGFDMNHPLTAGHHVIHVMNQASQSHELFITRLAPGKTAADVAAWVEKMDGPPPGMPMGGLTPLAPGETNEIVVDLAPGEYGLFCFVPDAKDGKPHVMHGMMRQITVK